MKDIEREVKALEVAMAAASDIAARPGDSYAYMVARIQQAILDVTTVASSVVEDVLELPVHNPSSPTSNQPWMISSFGDKSEPCLSITDPNGKWVNFKKKYGCGTAHALKTFVAQFNDPTEHRNTLLKSWKITEYELGYCFQGTNGLTFSLPPCRAKSLEQLFLRNFIAHLELLP